MIALKKNYFLKKFCFISLLVVGGITIGFSQEKTNSSISTNESTEITNLKGQIVNGFDKKPLQEISNKPKVVISNVKEDSNPINEMVKVLKNNKITL